VIEEKEEALLVTTATNAELNENNRLGAIEALAAMTSQTAEDELAKIGRTEGIDDELRKAAWRGLRRSKRAREKQANREAQA
jgi:ParB family chromosome partitioning protein